jgi:hypothetical protein
MLDVVVRNPNATIAYKSINLTVAATKIPASYDATQSNNFLTEKYLWSAGTFSKISPTSCGSNSYQFTDAALLRLHPISDPISNLKNVVQGYKIVSVGKFSGTGDATTRTIEAIKYLDAPSNAFDYAAFLDY